MNTPAYFAIDNLTVTPIPEPVGILMTGGAVLAGAVIGRNRRPTWSIRHKC